MKFAVDIHFEVDTDNAEMQRQLRQVRQGNGKITKQAPDRRTCQRPRPRSGSP